MKKSVVVVVITGTKVNVGGSVKTGGMVIDGSGMAGVGPHDPTWMRRDMTTVAMLSEVSAAWIVISACSPLGPTVPLGNGPKVPCQKPSRAGEKPTL